MKIDDIIFSKFVGNALPQSKMIEVERQLIADGEFSPAVEASIGDYEIHREEADVLLGQEEKEFSQEKKSEEVVRNDESIDSEKLNIVNTTIKTNSSMTINFTKDELLKIQALSAEFSKAEDKNLTLSENLVAFYLDQRPGVSKEEAEKVVADLTKGIQTFHEELTKALREGGVDYVARLHELGEDLTNEQKYELYVNFLATITVLDAQNFDAEKTVQIENFETIKNRFTVTGEVTEEMLAEVEERISTTLKDSTFCLSTSEMMGSLFDKMQDASSLEESLSGSEEDFRVKLTNAMMTYIAYQQGEIKSLAGQDIAPEFIAVGAAAGVEQARTMENYRLGRITWEDALDILKVIGGVLLWCYLTIFFAIVAVAIALSTFSVLTVLFGGSIWAMIMSALVSLYLVFHLSEINGEVMIKTLDWGESVFDNTVKFWQEKAWPFIKERTEAVCQWLREKLGSHTIEQVADEELQAAYVTQ